jgi:16S rRNA (uracil1498-N3)-methyltransferase
VTRAHAFVEDVDAPALADDDRHHLERVLRLRAGERFTVSDGRGRWRECRFGLEVEPVDAVVVEVAPSPSVTVGFALTKGEKPEWAVQKLTEVGADRIVLFAAEHSVVRWDDERAGRALARLRRVAREAAMQCRRAWLPQVDGIVAFEEALALPGAALADRGGAPPSLDRATVLVGPEGGWSVGERDAATAAGVPAVEIGPHVLRAETAAVVAGAVLAALRHGLVRPRHEG